MNGQGFEFDGTPAPADGKTRRQTERDPHAPMRAAPDVTEDDQQRDDAIEEPGYGHGV